MKGWLLAALTAILLLAGCAEEPKGSPAKAAETVPLGELNLVLSRDLTLQNTKESSLSSFYKDVLYVYDWKDRGKLKVKVRTIDNGDRFVMMQLRNATNEPLSLKADVQQSKANDYYFINWRRDIKERKHDPVIGKDVTTPPSGLLRYSADGRFLYEAVVSKQYQSAVKTQLYENGRQSTVRELTAEKETLQHKMDGFSFSLEAPPNQLAEQWFLLAKEPLFKNGDGLSSWIDFQHAHYKEVNNWFTVDGAIKKLPWSIEPFTKEGYGRHLGTLIEKEAIDRYFKYGDRYFYDLMVQSAANLLEYRQQQKSTVWKTEYTSTWLKQKYEITSPYLDTRHNELIALYLYRIGKEFDKKELTGALTDYADYLLNLIKIDNIVHTPKGYLPADYYSAHQGKQFIHTSLNHALGEANLLIDAYKATGQKKYLLAARQIRLGVESLGTKWIRPNGDLWYQVNRDLTFDGNDYEQLTLDDLERHEKKWQALGGSKSRMLQTLIESKRKAIQQ
ncbi:hypothetical protein [Pseudobacillus badius]|uniref:hypothetical protein n=1 Tax=Bacillus badius TaxID=1455 RepID=UPI0007B0AE52|nr:hypothetical protein [Bacillus badius]KZN99970.1 hypothetical protein A4244_03465 [Bacillus badius]OCS86135.1 hypothetical protein A6M11_03465 [Bacillus badius]OVE52404.1 hypothetical protein B1A98_08420 [Bacillus badius]TDW04140.1 hypothetical protein B0G66_103441 [Bacillus badius]